MTKDNFIENSHSDTRQSLQKELTIDPLQILQTNIIGIVWKTIRRITDEILWVKG